MKEFLTNTLKLVIGPVIFCLFMTGGILLWQHLQFDWRVVILIGAAGLFAGAAVFGHAASKVFPL
jgi:type IV secretory pathway VirB2 component (pilin)